MTIYNTWTFQSGATATGDGNEAPVQGITLVVDLTISASATVTFEGAGLSKAYVAIPATNLTTGAVATTATATGLYKLDVNDIMFVRVRVSTFGSGTISATGLFSDAPFGVTVVPGFTGGVGADSSAGVIKTEQRFSYTRLTADGQVKSGAGFLHALTFAQGDAVPTAGSIIAYDSLTETGTIIYSETFTTDVFRGYTVILDVTFATGLYIGFTTTADVGVTASYR